MSHGQLSYHLLEIYPPSFIDSFVTETPNQIYLQDVIMTMQPATMILVKVLNQPTGPQPQGQLSTTCLISPSDTMVDKAPMRLVWTPNSLDRCEPETSQNQSSINSIITVPCFKPFSSIVVSTLSSRSWPCGIFFSSKTTPSLPSRGSALSHS